MVRAMFPTTHWSVVAEATLSGTPDGRAALAALCEEYRPPILAFFRGRGFAEEDAQDVTQDFFLRLLDSRAWSRADRARGRFRTFLLGVLTHTLQHRAAHGGAQKRGAGATARSLDEMADAGFEPADATSEMGENFAREWAWSLVERATFETEQRYAGNGNAAEFSVLRYFLPGAPATLTYSDAMSRLRLSETALKAAVHRLRQAFRERLRAAVAKTVSAPHEVDEEMRYLQEVLGRAT